MALSSVWACDPTDILHDFIRISFLDGVSDSESFVVDFHRQLDHYRLTEVYFITVYHILCDKYERYQCFYNTSGEFIVKLL